MKPEVYQESRKAILTEIEKLKHLVDDLRVRDPAFFTDLPRETEQRFIHVDREITRLRRSNLTIAFVGGFSAGKSSLVNAFLGRYLLPESPEVTTAVPTFVRPTEEDEHAELTYLGISDIDQLGDLYRRELADVFKMPDLENCTAKELVERIKPLTAEGRGKMLLQYFEQFQNQRKVRDIPERQRVKSCSLQEMQQIVRNEGEAMFLDRVEVFIRNSRLPPDIEIVDLPGVSVPNPRHRQLTFRFVTQDAHAVVFVLLATRLFDRDELDILQRIRAGESSISQRTFWVLNRWDSLSTQQRQESLANFRAKMEEFSIPSDYVNFATNALHGLLAQLAMRKEEILDPKLQSHFEDYKNVLASTYGGSHDKAFTDSQVPELQKKVLDYLNNQLRTTTLTAAVNNTEHNLCQPLLHHLRAAKERDEQLIRVELDQAQQEKAREVTEQKFDQRMNELKVCFRTLRDEVAVNRAKLFADEARQLEDELRAEIEKGPTTDAYETYKRIISDNELRKFPYYFEIEMRVVDCLNSLLKRRFRQIVREQVNKVANELTKQVRTKLFVFSEDVGGDPSVEQANQDVLRGHQQSFLNQVDGVVKEKASHLDELLVYKPRGWFSFFSGDNDIISGLENAARMFSDQVRNVQQVVQPEHMQAKTDQIRSTLKNHYLKQTQLFREQVANSVWTIVIDEMLQLERNLVEQAQGQVSNLAGAGNGSRGVPRVRCREGAAGSTGQTVPYGDGRNQRGDGKDASATATSRNGER